jgi:anti-anti-sigma factor
VLEAQSRIRPVPSSVPSPPFECAPSAGPGGSRLTLTGELDIMSVSELDAALRRAARGAQVVVLDLQTLELIDSSGLRLLLETDRRLRRGGGRLVIERASEEVDWFLGLMGLDRLLETPEHRPLGAGRPTCGRRTRRSAAGEDGGVTPPVG